MAYISGECTGMFELLEIVKNEALEVGWVVLNEENIMFDKVYNNDSFVITDPKMMDDSPNTKGTQTFINLPRKRATTGIDIAGLDDGGRVSIYGVLEDNTEVLLKNEITSSCDIDNNAEYNRYKIFSTKNVAEAILRFDNNITLCKELFLQSSGSSDLEQININFKAFLVPNDYTNLIGSVTLGYSKNISFMKQQGALNSTLLGFDGEIKYFLNINKNRIIIAIKVHNENDSLQKEPVYQIGYFGKMRIYGGEWSFLSNYASIGGSYDTLARFSSIETGCLENPKLLVNGDHVTPDTNIGNWGVDNLDISPYPNGELYCSSIFYYKKNTKRIDRTDEKYFDGAIFGELDGIVKIIATSGISSEDIITINGEDYVVIQDGIKKDAYNLFAIKRG